MNISPKFGSIHRSFALLKNMLNEILENLLMAFTEHDDSEGKHNTGYVE